MDRPPSPCPRVEATSRLSMIRLLLLLPLAALLLAAAPAELDPARAIEVETVVPIVDGDAAAARRQALAHLFGEAVAVAAEGEAGVGVLADRPVVARRLRTHARDYVEAYQILADTYRLGGEENPAVAPPAPPGGVRPDLPPLPATSSPPGTASALPLPPPQIDTLPEDHYLVRLRAWIDRARLRTLLGLHPRAEADLTVTLHAVDATTANPERLETLRSRLTAALDERGWHLGKEEAAHHLVVEATSQVASPGEGRRQVTVSLTGRLQGEDGTVQALLQGHGSSTFLNLDFAWGEAEEEAVADLVAHLVPLLPPPEASASGHWFTVTLGPLPSYGAGLDLSDLIRDRATGVEEVQRGTYARRALRLRVRTTGDATALAAAIAALHWRDFTLRAEAQGPAEVKVELQRF